MNKGTLSKAGASPTILKYLETNETPQQEVDKVLNIKFYAEVTKRNGDSNKLEFLKIMQSAIENLSTARHRAVEEVSQLSTLAKEVHRRISPAATSNFFSNDNEKSQPQPRKKGRSSIIDLGDENRTLMHEIDCFHSRSRTACLFVMLE